ncbi:MAG: tyrosine-protein phosphatase, partial [Clostridia bacterium]|nr:tyrosine-protein phosphatase [Clostridia bacterium]
MPNKTIINNHRIVPVAPPCGATVMICTDKIPEWENGKAPFTVDQYYCTGGKYRPTSLLVAWTPTGSKKNRFLLSTSPNLSGSKVYLVQTDEIILEALFAGQQYYWQVEAIFDDRIECSDVFTFQTEDVPRGISLGPVGNTRDIGGMRLENGSRIRQGMVYRGGLLEEMQDRDRLHQQSLYGIVTDLDLRLPRETGGKTISPLGEHIRYCNIAGPCYLEGAGDVPGIEMPEGKAGLGNIFRLLAKADTYPVYIHCAIGRDRTGTV